MGYWGKIVAMGLNQSLVKIASKRCKRFGLVFSTSGEVSVPRFGAVISWFRKIEMPPILA